MYEGTGVSLLRPLRQSSQNRRTISRDQAMPGG